ncbi:hypothetical protein BH11MYX4_BH11MYX4_04010 [soil metagenome]
MKVEQGGKTLASGDIVATGLEHLGLEWAVASGRVLYVEHAVNGYTKESGGKTGYTTAIDMDSDEVIGAAPRRSRTRGRSSSTLRTA